MGDNKKVKVEATVILKLDMDVYVDSEVAFDNDALLDYLDNKAIEEAGYADSEIKVHNMSWVE